MGQNEQQDETPTGFVAMMDWAARVVATVLGVAALAVICLSLERVT
jgi:hypothetical protein